MTLTREDVYDLLTDERNRGVHIGAGVLSDIATALLAAWDERDALQRSQTYSYIGRDGKTVLARDLEDRAEAAEAKLAQRDAENARLRDALQPFCFFGENNDDTQTAWETRYLDRFKDWIDFEDIENARAALDKEPKP